MGPPHPGASLRLRARWPGWLPGFGSARLLFGLLRLDSGLNFGWIFGLDFGLDFDFDFDSILF